MVVVGTQRPYLVGLVDQVVGLPAMVVQVGVVLQVRAMPVLTDHLVGPIKAEAPAAQVKLEMVTTVAMDQLGLMVTPTLAAAVVMAALVVLAAAEMGGQPGQPGARTLAVGAAAIEMGMAVGKAGPGWVKIRKAP